MARVTERIRLGPAALNPFTLHPYEIAGQTAMLDLVSGGRAYLGLVKGAWLDKLGLDEERPLAGAAEAVEIVQKLLAGDTSGVAGERFTLAPGTALAYERVRPSVPLLIGTWGERTAAWAGTVAEELKIGGSANPELVPVVRGWAGVAGQFASSSAASPSSTRTATGRGSGRAPRWRRTSTSSRASTRRSSFARDRSRRSTASRSPGRRRRWRRR